MRTRVALYEVWCSRGTGMIMGPRFRHFVDARRWVDAHRHEASMAILGPDGEWEYAAPRTRHYSSRAIEQWQATSREIEHGHATSRHAANVIVRSPRGGV
jgi:hypothetical protein